MRPMSQGSLTLPSSISPTNGAETSPTTVAPNSNVCGAGTNPTHW